VLPSKVSVVSFAVATETVAASATESLTFTPEETVLRLNPEPDEVPASPPLGSGLRPGMPRAFLIGVKTSF
jgi:hypothetical protein